MNQTELVRQEAKAKNDFMRLVLAIQNLSHARDMETITAIVRKATRELSGSDGATFVLRENDQCYYLDEDAIAPLWKGKKFPMSACVSGWVMLNKTPAVIPDIYQDERVPVDAYRPTFVKSMVMVPIRANSPIGAIGTYWAKPYKPTDELIEILQALANSTSIAIENVKLYADINERLQEKIEHETKYRLLSEKLQVSLEEKVLLLKEVYHRVKNNMQIVSSLLNMQAETSSNDKLREDLQKSISRINSISLIHEMLYRSDNLSNIEMANYINQLTQFIHEMINKEFDNIHCEVIVDNIKLGIDKAVPCGIIINELIMNCIKHAFPVSKQGEISIIMRLIDNTAILTVKDNGIGLSKSTNTNQHEALGLDLIKILTKQIDGEIDIDESSGTSVTVRFPTKEQVLNEK